MNAPGKLVGTPFYIKLNIRHKKGQIITDSSGNCFKIIKTYHLTWWRKILRWFGSNIEKPEYLQSKTHWTNFIKIMNKV
jgi:hypothetical protein